MDEKVNNCEELNKSEKTKSDNPESENLNNENRGNRKNNHGCLRPAIAVIGFFVFLFLAAYLVHRFHAMWLVPVGIIVAFGWAIGFSLENIKETINNKKDQNDD